MKVSLKWIWENLWKEFPEYRDKISDVIGDENAGVEGISLYPEEAGRLSEDCLWFGEAGRLFQEKREDFGDLKFLLWGEEEQLKQIASKRQLHGILLGGGGSWIRLFNYLGEFFKDLNQWGHEMELVIACGEGLQVLLDTGKGRLSNPVLIWNPAFELQACTDWLPLDFEPAAEIVKNRKFSGKVIKRIIEMGYLDDPGQLTHRTVFYPPNVAGMPFALRVFSSRAGNVFAMVQYFPEGGPTAGDLELLSILEGYLDQYIKIVGAEAVDSSRRIYEPFLIELLEGKCREEKEIRDRLEYISMNYESEYRLLEIGMVHFTASLGAYVIRACETEFPFSRQIIFRERIFVVMDLSQRRGGNGFHEEKLEKLGKMLETVKGKCGISRSFGCLSQMYIARKEADEALEFFSYMDHERNYVYFQEIQFYTVLKTFENHHRIPLINLVSPELLEIYREDLHKKNDNIKLLDFYLNHNSNLTDTAKEMNLHRNSIIYRLSRMEERLGVDLSCPETRFRLQFMLKVLAFLRRSEELSRL